MGGLAGRVMPVSIAGWVRAAAKSRTAKLGRVRLSLHGTDQTVEPFHDVFVRAIGRGPGACRLGLGTPALAQAPVDTALVLAVDSSGSIDETEFRLQREGIAAALTSPRVLQAVAGGAFGRLAVAYVEWGSPGGAETVVGWAFVTDRASAEAAAAAIVSAPRSPQSYNAIGDAIDHAAGLFSACGCEATRRVIDLSGDNADMRSRNPRRPPATVPSPAGSR